MSDISRRAALGQLAGAFAAAGAIDALVAAEAHALVQQASPAGTAYEPKALSPQLFRTLERLTDLIIPAENGRPGAVQAGVPAWIDALLAVNPELQARYARGLGWLDGTMSARNKLDFASATPEQQTAVLDTIAFPKNRTAELGPYVDFFTLVRRMTVDGFYTSPIGMRDIYPGNTHAPSSPSPKKPWITSSAAAHSSNSEIF